MEEFEKHLYGHRKTHSINFTPLKSALNPKSRFKKIIFITLVPFLFSILAISIYLLNAQGFIELGLAGSVIDRAQNDENINKLQPTIISISPVKNTPIIPDNWQIKRSSACNVSIPLPPAEEPYVIPRDPNTRPSATDDEGRLWVYETLDVEFFMFNRMSRAIYKDIEKPGEVYISSAVEVYCMPNEEGMDVADLEKRLNQNLTENFSIVKIQESIDDVLWGRPAKLLKFSGGSFGNERYILYATDSNAYIIRAYGSTTNKDIKDVRDLILTTLEFN